MRLRGTRTAVSAALVALFAAAPSVAAPARDPSEVTIALGGDMIGPFHALPEKDSGFDAVRAIFRAADIGIANQEGSIFDLENFAGFPAPENGGGYPRQPRSAAEGIKDMGISLVSKGNNHATDWGPQGLLSTFDSLRKAGIAWAGAGASPVAACAPVTRGQVALVSAATTFPPMSLPTAPVKRQGPASAAGPGICGIHVQPVREVPAADLAALKAIAGPLAMEAGPDGRGVRIGDQRFIPGAKRGLDWEMKPEDLVPIMAAIGATKATKDDAFLYSYAGVMVKPAAMIFAVHAHETAGTDDEMPPKDFEPLVLHRANEAPSANNPEPAAFVPRLARRAIDAGADVVMRTGPHTLGGIELYRGKPIFYSLGSLFFDFGGRKGYTAAQGQSISFPPEWYETVIPVVTKRGGRIVEIRLHPATIDPDAGATGGLPQIATGPAAQRILARLQALSRPYNTMIRIDGDVGVIRIGLFD